MKKVLVLGASGQLGRCIRDVVAVADRSDTEWIFTYRGDDVIKTDESNKERGISMIHLEPSDEEDLRKTLFAIRPEVIINCIAYTDVVKAETSEGMDASYVANVQIPENLVKGFIEGRYYNDNKPTIIHISTDFVFNGMHGLAYTEEDTPCPINIYGQHKLCGEEEILKYEGGIVIRTSWLYSKYGKNFVKKIANNLTDKFFDDDTINVVDYEIGSPTYAMDLAEFLVGIVIRNAYRYNHGIYHYCNQGVCSRYDLALAIQNELGLHGKIFPTKERFDNVYRPTFSVLDTTKAQKVLLSDTFSKIPHWTESLKKYIRENYG